MSTNPKELSQKDTKTGAIVLSVIVIIILAIFGNTDKETAKETASGNTNLQAIADSTGIHQTDENGHVVYANNPRKHTTVINKVINVEQITIDFREKYLNWYDDSFRPLVKYVKDNMNDPESFEHDKTIFQYDTKNDCMWLSMQYRGKNAYGGVVRNAVRAKVSMSGELLDVESYD